MQSKFPKETKIGVIRNHASLARSFMRHFRRSGTMRRHNEVLKGKIQSHEIKRESTRIKCESMYSYGETAVAMRSKKQVDHVNEKLSKSSLAECGRRRICETTSICL